jgi:hypothetical protein
MALLLGFTAVSVARANFCTGVDFSIDFDTEYPDCFQDVFRGAGINSGPDQGGTGHLALNFTGSAGAAGATWLTILDTSPPVPDVTLCADVLIQRFNNRKGAGVVARFNQGPGRKGLALIASNAGNTDRLILATVDGDPARVGALTTLETVPLGAGIRQNQWYRVIMYVGVASSALSVTGEVYEHVDPLNPNSPLSSQVGSTLLYVTDTPPVGILPAGFVGLIAIANSAVVNSSITNFGNDTIVPCEPAE